MIKNSQNIFITFTFGIYNFLKNSIFSLFSLLFFKKIDTIEKKEIFSPFLTEILEKGPKRFFSFPTAIRLGRALFTPILYLFSQKKNDKNS